MKVFIIDWTDNESSKLIDFCKSLNAVVDFELKDGAEAYRKTSVFMPDVILINYAVKPSHGRISAEAILKRKSTSKIPVYFVNGASADNDKVKTIGNCITTSDIENILGSK